jgi:diguanylate cyclase (GGDEF)-like protein/PAS domain S-box-containing protein
VSLRSGSILVVDDNEMNRDVLSRRLQRQGYDVSLAENGRAALALLETTRVNLVLLDIEMPGLSGTQVLAAIRERHTAAELPVIMVTARQESQDIVEALGAGANDYVTKPIDFAVAVARIETQLARQQAEAALRVSEERYALAVRGANDGLWDWDLRTNAIYLSPRWKAMLGWGESEVADDPAEWFDRVHPDEVERVKSELAAHLSGKAGHFETEHRMLHRDGTYRWMRSRGLAVRDATGCAYRMAGSQTDITEGKVADALTGLPNRILFIDRLGYCIDRARRREASMFAVLFLDLDRFKIINDSLGHVVGDQLLVALARRLEGCLRASDLVARVNTEHTIARLGGDEFTILLEDIRDVSDALRVAERVQETVAQPFALNGQEVFTTASIGIATSATHYDSPEVVLRDADTAMYRAKSKGGGRCEVFDSAMRDRAVARLQLETDLRRAVEREEFRLHYQPIVSLSTGQLTGFEALIRWQHPDRGLIAPDDFIGVAEETAVIGPIGWWVLREACRQMRCWQLKMASGLPLTISVNLSPRQFAQSQLAKELLEILAETGLPAQNLKLEITETTIMESTESASAVLAELKRIGIQLAIDDFGTGYSSLSYVHRFPLDALKIDRSFITEIGTGQRRSEIVRAIVNLAHNLGLEVIAEGVETRHQLDVLRSLGCEYGQGYLFSRPVEADAAQTFIVEGTIAGAPDEARESVPPAA